MTLTQHDLISHFATAARDILSTDWITTVLPDMTAEAAIAALHVGADSAFHAVACAHRAGDKNATTVLIGINSRALGQLAKYASTTDIDERAQIALGAYLQALETIVGRGHAASKTYYCALKLITKRSVSVTTVSVESETLENTLASEQPWRRDDVLTASAVLDFAVQCGVDHIDADVLRHAHCRDKKVSVRILAAELGVTEHKLESQIRRAKDRVREAIIEHADELDVYLLQHTLRVAKVATRASTATRNVSAAA